MTSAAPTGNDAASGALARHGWEHVYSGKVRDLFRTSTAPDRLLVVASDRVSAFDRVLEPGIPGKGALLTRLSRWWFGELDVVVGNHLVDGSADEPGVPAEVADRAMLVRRLEMVPIECVVRGYLAGSGWAEYREHGTLAGVPLPPGLEEGDRLPEPLFTPATKAPQGEHDENIDFAGAEEIIGAAEAEAVRDASLRIFDVASRIAEQRGLLLVDTKFEFGRDPLTGAPVLADEVLTSDSSRYWDAEAYAAGGIHRMASFDKQIVRDWLAANWDRLGDPPPLPPEIVARTAARYAELIDRLTA